jgi:DNA-binding XRE family transcriptional regulator
MRCALAFCRLSGMHDHDPTTLDAAEMNIRLQLIWIADNQTSEVRPERSNFGQLLRRHRHLAQLTQEDLAERAGLSARSISDIERGASHVPRYSTVRLLAGALELSDDQCAALERSVARRRGPRRVNPKR